MPNLYEIRLDLKCKPGLSQDLPQQTEGLIGPSGSAEVERVGEYSRDVDVKTEYCVYCRAV